MASNTRQVALISGAGRGIGAAIAKELGRLGYHVVVNYRRDTRSATSTVDEIVAGGGSAQLARADVCDAEAVAALVGQVHAQHGRLDLLICNANTVEPPIEPLPQLSWENFAGKLVGELAGAFFLTQQVLKIMSRRRSGRIIYVSSTAADHIGGSVAHSTAKAALNTFSRHVAGAAATRGITVNVVASGVVATDANLAGLSPRLREHFAERTVFRNLVQAEQTARAVALIADEKFAAVTGQLIRVDGGLDVLTQQLSPTAGWNLEWNEPAVADLVTT